jgi:DNA topoisomerase II
MLIIYFLIPDGSHIKGLIINFFRHFWPKLLMPPVDVSPEDACNYPPFMSSFVTPLLKATRKSKRSEVLPFYSLTEYNHWRASLTPEELKTWKVKYYKGLGTSTPVEAKDYFKNYDNHHRPFAWNSDVDGELLDMVFDRERAADRRDWILKTYGGSEGLSRDSVVAHSDPTVSYEDFVNKELIHFSHYDNVRSIPSAMDGLKPSQRKVLYACFKRNLKQEIKVAQLSGYCAEHTAYHHGEASLQATSK